MNTQDFMTFWETYFPEQNTLTRTAALQQIGTQQQFTTTKDLTTYQNRVAFVYGAYERAEFQQATMQRLLTLLPPSTQGTLVSLGAGPGSYELWLLAHNVIQKCILVDISPQMLERADNIAKQLGVRDRITLVCSEIAALTLPDASADLCWSINSLHWDEGWREWVKKAIKGTKPDGWIFLSASMLFPQSNIMPEQFSGVAARGINIQEQGYLLQGGIIGNQYAQPTRYFVSGYKIQDKQLRAKKKKR